jgi:HlyD family secretion protein
MRSFVYPVLICLLVSASCKNEKINLITLKIGRTDFVEKLNVTGTVQAVNNQSVLSPRSQYGTMTITHLAPDGEYVKKGDTICILSSPDLNNFYETFTTALENMEADMKKLVADNALNMSLLEAQVETNMAQMKISSLDSVQIKYAPPVKQKLLALEMEKASVERKKLAKKLASQKIIDESEIRQINSRIIQQKARIQMMTDQIKALTIVAPTDGIVMHTEFPGMMMMRSSSGATTVMGGKIKEGSTVFSNMVVLQFPDLSRMQISVEIAEADYKRI